MYKTNPWNYVVYLTKTIDAFMAYFMLVVNPLINSLGSMFSSQGHFHTLQLLNVPQFLFCRLVRLKTTPTGNFSHT